MNDPQGASPTPDRRLPSTDDPAVDRILQQLDEALASDEADSVAAVTQAHRLLQAHLTVPAVPPDEAHPGPR